MKKIDLRAIEKKIKVRTLKKEDYDDVVELQKLCFPGMKPWKKEQFYSQIEIFPEGQICVELNKKIIASSSSLIIDFDLYQESDNWQTLSDSGYITNHDPDAETLYGIEIMVHPDFRSMKIARRIYNARKELAVKLNLKNIVVGGRIPGYKKYKNKLTPREYVEKVINKDIYDPVLTSQLANGFVLKRIIPQYLTSDEESDGYATLLEWSNIDYIPPVAKKVVTSKKVRICAVQYMMRPINGFDEFATQCEYFTDVASGYKSDFVLFPEIFTLQLLSFLPNERPGLAVRKLAEFTNQYLDLFNNLAIKYNINIIGGSHFTKEGDDLYNISYLFRRDGTIEKQYKIHITPNERRWWGIKPGDKIEVFETDRGKINIQICYDVEFPELSRIAVSKGAEIIFVPFCTDERYGYLRVRQCVQARCIENGVYAAMAGNVGNLPFVENMDIQYAQSGIYTPSDFMFSRDAIAAECTPNVETVVIHDLDLELLKRHRSQGSTLNWFDRRQDLYEVVLKK
ncbi:bifunctional GNAT family N-acetyltransferase/carbon-nitrogen hydrolase family protein [Ignavibacterium sp.]|uniref:bifunctional GNAT family N-acetyltransferase/carbon-nitrogen hydrolase family protein n=1 Tax=Ignavibacterium sp. TaxID=2651167 RepID=UPI0021FA1856|nr:bifunctional GNAT family N-acetyltransferase/carbon-nitrogen hydrolase family protein [Ignavibacterium sp.]BDQ03335.1 MAG: hydrolase YhcX [Ignavibacterium sp.]